MNLSCIFFVCPFHSIAWWSFSIVEWLGTMNKKIISFLVVTVISKAFPKSKYIMDGYIEYSSYLLTWMNKGEPQMQKQENRNMVCYCYWEVPVVPPQTLLLQSNLSCKKSNHVQPACEDYSILPTSSSAKIKTAIHVVAPILKLSCKEFFHYLFHLLQCEVDSFNLKA